jgi:DNA-binding SARP family transcriptional activator
VDVLVLGPVEAHDERGTVDLGPPKQRALLALLALRADAVVPAETIVEELWEGRPPRKAEAGLQTYVSNLRRLLEPARGPRSAPSILLTRAPGYLLRTDALRLDVRTFLELAEQGSGALARGDAPAAVDDLERALRLWRGPAYADIRDLPAAAADAARLDQLRLSAIEHLAEARIATGHAARAAADLTAFTREHPLRERAWCLLAEALHRCDRQAEALAALASARTRLQEDLGIDPGPALRELELAILRQDPALTAGPAGRASPDARQRAAPATTSHRPRTPASASPFVGRAAELEALRAATTRGGVVLVEGEPGMGKTRLVEEFVAAGDRTVAHETAAPGTAAHETVGWGRWPEHEVAPALWAWESALRDVVAARPEVAVPRTVADLLSTSEGTGDGLALQDAAGARLRLYEDITAYLAASAPLVVVLDDLHWADTASQRLLIHVATAVPEAVIVIATFRSHEAAALTATLAALARAGAARLPLTGLPEPDVRALVTALTGLDPGAEGARDLYRRTGGNALFLTLAAHGVEAADPPRQLREVVLQRLTGLEASAVELLRTAAVAGDDVDVGVLVDVAARPEDDVLDDLDAALAAGLLRDDDTPLGTYRFTHALVREALDGGHSRMRRARLHRRYAEAIERIHGDDDERAGELARHWLAAADLGPECARAAAHHAARAARAAQRRLAPEDAVSFWQESLAAGRLAGDRPQDGFDALVGLVEAHYAAGQTTEGLALLDDLLDTAGSDPGRVTAAAVAALGQSSWYPFDYGLVPHRLLAALEAAVRALPQGTAELALALGCLGALQCHAGLTHLSPATSAAAVAAARAVRQEGDDTGLLARVLLLRLLALHGWDHTQDGLAAARELQELPGAPPAMTAAAHLMQLSCLLALGRLDEAAPLEAGLQARIEAARSPTLQVQGALAQSALLAFRGRLDEAAALSDAVYRPLESLGLPHLLATWTTQRLERALQRGDFSEVGDELVEVRRRTRIEGYGASQALALALRGRRDEARRMLDAIPVPPRDYTWAGTVAVLLLAAIELRDLDRVAELRNLLLPFRDRLVVMGTCTAIAGAVAQHTGEAALALGDHDAARDELSRAVDLLDRARAPLWAAKARAALSRCAPVH